MSDREQRAPRGRAVEPRPSASPAAAKKAMKETLALMKAIGGWRGGTRKLKKDRSPQAMLATLGEGVEANAARRGGRLGPRREPVSPHRREEEGLRGRPRRAQGHPRGRVAQHAGREYDAAERELKVLLENERILSQVRGRLNEALAYGLATVERGS